MKTLSLLIAPIAACMIFSTGCATTNGHSRVCPPQKDACCTGSSKVQKTDAKKACCTDKSKPHQHATKR